MTFKPALWYPIAVLLSVINVVAVGFATGPTRPWHATIHAVLAVAFGSWAYHLRQGPGGSRRQVGIQASEVLEALQGEVSTLRRELSETQERLDFVERLLAQEPDLRRMRPDR